MPLVPDSRQVSPYVTPAVELDQGQVLGSRNMRAPTASIFNRQSVGLDQVIFSDYFNASAQNTAVWTNSNNLFTTTFGTNAYVVMNSALITTTAAASLLQTRRTFPLWGQAPVLFEFSEFRSVVPPANHQYEAGIFLAGGTTPFAPTDGVYFRFNSSGLFGVMNFNGVETSTQLLTASQLVLADNTTFRIIINHYRVEFWGASSTSSPRQLLLEIGVPAVNGPAFSAISAPAGFRLVHTGAAGAGVAVQIANVACGVMDVNQGTPVSHLMNGMGFWPQQGQNGGTMGSTALYSNSLAAGAGAAMTNTTAALGTGFGGQFSTQPTLAAGTDGIVCSYQNPAGSVTQTPRTIFITGVKIQSAVTTVLVGGPVLYAYSLAVGHTAVSMATAEASNAKAPRRIPLGFETYAAAAAVDTMGAGLYMAFNSPIPVNPGEFVAIVAKNLGTVTTGGVITFLVTYDAYSM